MSYHRHLGIIAILIPQGPNTVSPFGDFAKEWMFGSSPTAFPQYFRDVSAGLIDISGAEFFGVGVVQDQSMRDQINAVGNRNESLKGAARVARSMGVGDLRRFDGIIFIVMGQAVNAGAGGIVEEGESIPAALLDDRGSYSFMAHEIAHVLGFGHSHQLSWHNPSGILYGEYGDPTDIMSAETFGGNGATFSLPFDPVAPVAASAGFWQSAGPGMSPSTLWRYLPGFPQKPDWVHMLPADSAPTQVTLKAAGQPGTTLAVMPRALGGWWCVEYRPASGWDRGLTYRPFALSSSPGIVIHEILDVGNSYVHPSYPRKVVNYRTTIPVPSSGDNDWVDTGIGVRIVQSSAHQATVLIGASIPDHRAVSLGINVAETESSRESAGLVWSGLAGPRCEGAWLMLERVRSLVQVTCKVTSIGFFDTRFSFSIDGVQLTAPRPAASSPIEDTLVHPVQAMIPIDLDNGSVQPRAVPIAWSQAGSTLTLTLPAGVGRYTLKVTGIAEDNTSYKAQSQEDVEVISEIVEYSPDATEKIEQCLRHLVSKFSELHMSPRQLPTLPGPGEEPDWKVLRGIEFVKVIAQLNHPEALNQFLVNEVRTQLGRHIGAGTLATVENMYRKMLFVAKNPTAD